MNKLCFADWFAISILTGMFICFLLMIAAVICREWQLISDKHIKNILEKKGERYERIQGF